MIGAAQRAWDSFFGRGESAVTVPVMDGPLKPNRALDLATRVAEAAALDNLVRTTDGVVFSSGASLLREDGSRLATFEQPITCLAAASDGTLAIGLEGGGILLRGGPSDGRRIDASTGVPASCMTAATFLDPRTLVMTQGSSRLPSREWRRDLMTLGRSGAVWRIDLDTGRATFVRSGLAWPWGIAPAEEGHVFVAESWRHRILKLDARATGAPEVVLGDLPGYPARIVPAYGGGYWLCFASVRNQLVEHILREREYRTRMLAEVPEPYWMAPALSGGGSFKEPLQGSGLKQMGILKPWAATRSYGLVVRCDAGMQPLRSWHSRADGRAHGVLSAAEHGDDLLVAATGPGWLLRLDGVAGERAGTGQ